MINIDERRNNMHKTMMDATDVAQALGISKSHAYKIVRELNRDLKSAGYIVIAGKIPKAYWEQRFYGGSNHAS
jgi:fructose-1-phosphate kinase PfkB-like protein